MSTDAGARPGVPRAQPFFPGDMQTRIAARVPGVLGGWVSRGPLTQEFEESFARYVGARHAIAVNSGTSALYALLWQFDLRGGEVIVPAMTCFACASAIVLAGGRPRIANVDPESMCLDGEDAVRLMNGSTRGVLAVHLAGQIMPGIIELGDECRARGLFLLEDAAHATGASLDGRRAGTFGDAACFSFHPTKIMTSGEGGMITTDTDAIAERCRAFRDSSTGEGGGRSSLGMNLTMPEMSAALGLEQLAALDGFVRRRNEIVARYRERLEGFAGARLLPLAPGRISSHWKAYVRLAAGVDRDRVMDRMLQEYGVDVRPAYRPLLHGHPALRDYAGDPAALERSDRAMASLICLPVFVGLEDHDIDRVVESLKACLS